MNQVLADLFLANVFLINVQKYNNSKSFIECNPPSVAKKWLDVTIPEVQTQEVAIVVVLCSIAEDAWDVKVKHFINTFDSSLALALKA